MAGLGGTQKTSGKKRTGNLRQQLRRTERYEEKLARFDVLRGAENCANLGVGVVLVVWFGSGCEEHTSGWRDRGYAPVFIDLKNFEFFSSSERLCTDHRSPHHPTLH